MQIDLSALAAKYGIDPASVANVKTAAEVEAERAEESRTSVDAGTLLLQSLHAAHPLALLKCKGCSRSFQSNYCKEWYCSDTCMKRDFQRHFGVSWDNLKPGNSDFHKEASKIVGPDTTEALYEWCRAFVDAYETPTTSPEKGLSESSSRSDLFLQESAQALGYTPEPETSVVEHLTTGLVSREHYLATILPPEPVEQADPFAGIF